MVVSMDADTARSKARARSWWARTADWRAWVHALSAGAVGAVFSILVRNLGIAAVVAHGVYFLFAALAVLAAALAFGALARIFTERRAGWVLAATVVLWIPAIVAVSFLVFSSSGSFDHFDPVIPLVGGLVAGVVALLAWGGPPRWLALLALFATAVTLAVAAFSG